MVHKALVVDDNFYNRDIARLALEDAGYDVVEAENGREALQYLDIEAFDLLILDLAMPKLDGVGVVTELRKKQHLNHMKIIIITAYSHMADGIEMDVDFVMYKPIDIVYFVSFIQRLKAATV